MPFAFDRPLDVVIAGAGLAGASLALNLARSGLAVALLDAARFPRPKLCGEFLSPECWPILYRLGLCDRIAETGFEPIRRVRLSTPRGRILESEIPDADSRPGLGLSRVTLDQLLVERARDAGAVLVEQTRVVGPVIDEGRVVGLRARHPVEGLVEVRAKVVIASDGRHSGLVRRTGTTRGSSFLRPRLFGLKCHLDLDPGEPTAEPPGTVGLHLMPGGYVGACRIEQQATNLCGLLPESLAARYHGNLDRLANEAFRLNPTLERLWSAGRPSTPWKTVADVRVERSFPSLPGILYAGDCQGTVDPLGGQGMTMALLGGELLAPLVLEAVRRGMADMPLQRRADAAWHQRFAGRVRLCRLFHHILVNPALIDLATAFPTLASHLLSKCFEHTRDPEPAPVPS